MPPVQPFTGLNWPSWVAVDTAGNLYVTDMGGTDPGGQYRVFKLPVT